MRMYVDMKKDQERAKELEKKEWVFCLKFE
jgi:hypothetical protein